MNILVVDDEKDSCDYLSNILHVSGRGGPGYHITEAYRGKDALELMKSNSFDLILSDVGLPDVDGIEIARFAGVINPKTIVILISGKGELIQTINSIELGIYDFLTKPVDIKKLIQIVRKAEAELENENSRSKTAASLQEISSGFIELNKAENEISQGFNDQEKWNFGIFSDKMEAIYKKIRKLQEYPQIPLLIRGETGTGKEVMARFTHYENPYIKGPFVAVNCSNLNRELFESELFGYEKGAFTGADAAGKEGKIKSAENGTLFLDEVAEIPMDLQAKLLRVIEEKEYYQLGSTKKQKVNTRLVFATNRNIQEMIKNGTFREDLYFRLNLCEVTIPPLRDRKDEIIPLAVFLICQLSREFGKNISRIERSAVKLLENQHFVGNVRELKNIITKIVLFSESETIVEQDIKEFLQKTSEKNIHFKIDLKNLEIPDHPFSLEELDRAIIQKTLQKFSGNKTKTAEYLGLNRIQLYGRFKDLDK